MPLFDGYGVLVGRVLSYTCNGNGGRQAGRYYHCTIMVSSSTGVYRCPVDLDSKEQKNGIEWRIVELGASSSHALASLADGWHHLPSTPESGALDYCRSPELAPGALWQRGTSRNAFIVLSPLLRQSRRVFVFGEPFRRGRGVHNIHQNQGDPVASHWALENGPWQDGAVVVERGDGSMAAFLCRFRSQECAAAAACECGDGVAASHQGAA